MLSTALVERFFPQHSKPLIPSQGFAAITVLLALACGNCSAQSQVLVGAGSTVPLPLYTKWAEQYNKRDPNYQMRYLPLGTSEGIDLVGRGSADFGAGEVPLNAKQRTEEALTEVPTALIGIVPIYNLPGMAKELRFSGEVLGEIFLGRVKTWNSAAIAKLNPDVPLPDLPIKIIYRPAGKGSNYVFTDFLSKKNRQFRSEIGVTSSPKWPIGTAATRSEDMVEAVKNQAGSIGYVELQYAIDAHVPYGSVENESGAFVKASNKSIAAACESVESPRWEKLSASLTDASGSDSYPITSFTWLYVSTRGDTGHRAALVSLIQRMLENGQEIAESAGYAELPPPLLKNVEVKLNGLH